MMDYAPNQDATEATSPTHQYREWQQQMIAQRVEAIAAHQAIIQIIKSTYKDMEVQADRLDMEGLLTLQGACFSGVFTIAERLLEDINVLPDEVSPQMRQKYLESAAAIMNQSPCVRVQVGAITETNPN